MNKRWAGLPAVLAVAAAAALAVTSFLGNNFAIRPPRKTPNTGPGPVTPAPPTSRDPQTIARWLGWQLREARDGGVAVVLVYEGGPAARAGVAPGDRIVTVRRQRATLRAVLAAIQATPIGEELALERGTSAGEVEAVSIRVESATSVEALSARTIAAGVKALAALQGADGLWPHFESDRSGVAVSALACAALAAVGSSGAEGVHASLEKGTAALLARRAPDGGLDDGPAQPNAHRVYANAAFALALGGRRERDELREWLARAQIRASDPLDPLHGGFRAYQDHLRSDVSVTAWALEALAACGLPDERPEWLDAARFLDRCQNLEVLSDGRELPLRDGGFAFAPGVSKAGVAMVSEQVHVPRSYGSATADGVRALVALGALRDPRLDAALAWLARTWTVEEVPGAEDTAWSHGLELHWLSSVARALHQARVDRLGGHDWADEVTRVLARKQDPASGAFATPGGLMGTDSPSVGTALALLALAAARDRHSHGGGRAVEATLAAPPPPLVPWGPGDATTIERGRQVFQGNLGCVGCHSDVASGNGPSLVGVADRYLEWHRERAAAKVYFKRHIRDPRQAPGQRAQRWPSDRMPSFGELSGLGDEDLEALVEFLLARQGTLPVAEARAPGSAIKGSAQRGQEVAFDRKCASCHDVSFFLAHKRPDLTRHPAFAKPLSEQELADILAFLRTLR